MWKKALKIVFLFLFLFGIERFCYKQTAGFRIQKISTELPYNPKWEVETKPPLELLSGPYTFLGSGVQCYAFESADCQTVLKVFKHYHSFPSNNTLQKMSLPSFIENYRKELLNKRYKRLYSIFNSAALAYKELREETGLIYLHLNRTNHLNKTLTLIDKLGNHHFIDLDNTAFLLQKKGELLFVKLSSLIDSGDIGTAKQLIHSLICNISSRAQKRIVNTDPILGRNFGSLEGRAIEIDIGSFVKNPAPANSQELRFDGLFEIGDLESWLEKNHPFLIPFFQEELRAHT